MQTLPDDFFIRADAMTQQPYQVRRAAHTLKSYTHPQWVETWVRLADEQASNTVQGLTIKVGFLALACYPRISDAKRESAFISLKRSYKALCELEGASAHYDTFKVENHVVPYYYRKANSTSTKPTIIFIRGLDSFKEVRYWDEVSLLNTGYDIVGIDFPGMGENPLAMTEHADDVFITLMNHIQKRFGSQTNFIIWGLGFGGYWALKLGKDSRVKAIINQGGPVHYSFKPRLKRILFHYSEIRFLKTMIAQALHHKQPVKRFIDKLSLKNKNVLSQISCPVLYINGQNDKTVSDREIEILKHEINPKLLQVQLLKNAGHLAIDQFDTLMPQVVTWLNDLNIETRVASTA
ncbi:alpha/beta fold hydrolase [Bermanella sp. R86510]|uniref:alpha/beta fold hydrolase n=1 Tax=unclassified Bermanella TaxID=2627862 RepID=UPI0037CA4F16